MNFEKIFAQLKLNPGRIFGLAYPYMFVIIVSLGLFYVDSFNQLARQTVPPALPDTTMNADIKLVEAKSIPPMDINNVRQSTPEIISKGENIFNSVCASCHGEDGQGKGPAAAGINPPPRNFTNSEGWKNGPKISGIYRTLEEGIPGTSMISYDYLTPDEKVSLAHYIRQTFIPNAPGDSQEDILLLDQTYNLSKGAEIPAQIPVNKAIDILTKESDSSSQKIISVLGKISSEGNGEGAKIFNRVTNNKGKAVTTLASSQDWKADERKFVSIITSNLNTNGFNGKVNNLTTDEWNALYSYAVSLF